MQLLATTPFLAPPDLRPLALETLSAIAQACFVSLPAVLAFAKPLGLTEEPFETWARAGFLHVGTVHLDPLLAEETRYVALTPAGAREMGLSGRAVQGISAARLKRSSQKRAHDVFVGDTALAVLTAARFHGVDLVGLEADDRRLGTSAVLERIGKPPCRVALQADLFFAVREDGKLRGFLVEVDRGTIAPLRMAEKYAAYLTWWRSGGPERDFGLRALQVLTVARDARRLERLHEAALGANHGKRSGFLLFLDQKDVTPADAGRLKEPVVRVLGEELARPLFHA